MANYHSVIMAGIQLMLIFFVLLSASRVFAAPQNYDEESNANEENEIFDLPEFISTGGNKTARIGKDFRLQCQVGCAMLLLMMIHYFNCFCAHELGEQSE